MTTLVTGANGFVGSAVVRRLLETGDETVRCLVRGTAVPAAASDPSLGGRVEVVRGNLLAPETAARAVDGIDAVIHLAASMRGSPADMFLNTVVASRNLLDAVVAAGRPRTVLVSSMGVYGVAGLAPGARVDEATPLEPHPERRDVYSHAKWRQETLFREMAEREEVPLVVLRPGVIFGPGGAPMSARVGLNLFGCFLHLGGGNVLPLTYVDNCADAIVLASRRPEAVGETFNVVDDDPPTSRQYLRAYRRRVRRIRFVPVPYGALQVLSRAVAWYHRVSHGQLPAVFTPYKTASAWKGTTFDNRKLTALGWRPLVPMDEGLERTFAYLRAAEGG